MDLVDHLRVTDDGKLVQHKIHLRLRRYPRPLEARLDRIVELLSVRFPLPIADKHIDSERPVLNLLQRQQDAGHDERFVLILDASVVAQILVQRLRLTQYLGCLFLPLRRLSEYLTLVIFLDIQRGKRDQRIQIRKYRACPVVVHKKWCDAMPALVARNAQGKDLLIMCMPSQVYAIKQCPIDGILHHRPRRPVETPRVVEGRMPVRVSLVLDHDQELPIHHATKLRAPHIACPRLRGCFECLVDLPDVAPLC